MSYSPYPGPSPNPISPPEYRSPRRHLPNAPNDHWRLRYKWIPFGGRGDFGKIWDDVFKKYFPNGLGPDTISQQTTGIAEGIGKRFLDEIGKSPALSMGKRVDVNLGKLYDKPVTWERVNTQQLQNPMQVIEGAREVLQNEARRMSNQAAARFGQAGMGLSTPYLESLAGIQGETATKLSDISNRYLFEAARERQQAELQAALANQAAGLQAQEIERKGILGALGLESEYDFRKAQEALERERARGGLLESAYGLGSQLTGESWKSLLDWASKEATSRYGYVTQKDLEAARMAHEKELEKMRQEFERSMFGEKSKHERELEFIRGGSDPGLRNIAFLNEWFKTYFGDLFGP